MSLVRQLECKANVHLRFFGVDCWPVVRNTFMSIASHGIAVRTKKTSFVSYTKALRDFIFLFFRFKNTDAIVISDSKYIIDLHGKAYYQDASVIKKLLSESGKKCHIITQNAPKRGVKSKECSSIFFLTAFSSVVARILMRFDLRKKIPSYLVNIYSSPEFENVDSSTKSIRQIKQNIYFVVVASFLLQMLLKRIRPEKCFIVCYYSCLGMALCVACRRLGIESVDLQHGVSGSNMRAYGQWNNIPLTGLNTLPNSFYCWTLTDVEAINSWSAGNKHHYAFLSGSIWRQYLFEEGYLLLPEERVLAEKVSGYKKVILYTARNSDLPDIVLTLLKISPKDYFFMIRMHPDTPDSEIKVLEQKLKSTKCSYLLHGTTKIRIHIAAQLTDVHITEWSATVYDVYFENSFSIVISEIGKDYFNDFILQGRVFYCRDVKCLSNKIEELYKVEKCYNQILSLSELKSSL